MIKYKVRLKFNNHPQYFIELQMNYYLPFHPNITDEIMAYGLTWKINHIYYDLDDIEYLVLNLETTEGMILDDASDQEIIEGYQALYDEFKDWCLSNNDKFFLSDWCLPKGYEINEHKDAE